MSALQVVQNHRIALDSAFPGLVSAIEQAANHQLTQEEFIHHVLISLKNTSSFADGLESLSPERKKQLLDFIGGKKASEVVGGSTNWPPPPPPPPPPGNDTPDVHLSSLCDGNGQPIKVSPLSTWYSFRILFITSLAGCNTVLYELEWHSHEQPAGDIGPDHSRWRAKYHQAGSLEQPTHPCCWVPADLVQSVFIRLTGLDLSNPS